VFRLLTKRKDSELLLSELSADNCFVCVLVKLGLNTAHSHPVVNVGNKCFDFYVHVTVHMTLHRDLACDLACDRACDRAS
jgi:hypothetical protein